MRYIFKFPDIGEGLDEGRIIEWYVKKGQEVEVGDSLVKMETDKVVTDIPSPKNGVVSQIFGNPGETIHVGDVLVELDIEGVEGEEAQNVAKEEPSKPRKEQIEEKGFGVVGTLEVAGDGAVMASSDEAGESDKPNLPTRKKVLATPVARAMAKDFGIDINLISGTGPAGRVTKKDIQQFAENSKKSYSYTVEEKSQQFEKVELIPLSQIRKTIAKNMTRSKHNAAHMTVIDEIEVSELIKIRSKFKDDFSKKGLKLTYMPFIMMAAVKALKNHPKLNAELDLENGNMIKKNFFNFGIAVDTPDGLIVPVIKDVDKKSITELTEEMGNISKKTQEKSFTLEDLKDGTFTITNYGSIGGYIGVPVINYPQSAILGIGRIDKKPVVKDDQIVVGNVLPISMSVDHRIIDGGDVNRFMNEFLGYLKDPVSLIL